MRQSREIKLRHGNDGFFAIRPLSFVYAILFALVAAPVSAETISLQSLEKFNSFFVSHGYAIEGWKKGTQKIPRLLILDIPKSWGTKTAPKLTVKEKKQTFFRFAIPLVFVANEAIAKDREKLQHLMQVFRSSKKLTKTDQEWLLAQATKYDVMSAQVNEKLFDELMVRIDIIPPSLAVAQMADESGWGTSRFATEGNALFGQWSYSGGIKPEHQRSKKGDYRVEAFKTPLASVQAYMINLSSGHAYREFRARRAQLRAAATYIKGTELVGTLINYSERREAYVRDITNMIKKNNLAPLDARALADGETVFIRLSGSNS